MDESLFNLTEQLVLLAGRFPLILTLIAGLVICYQQRTRRPRAALLFGVALSIELVLNIIGWEIYGFVTRWMGLQFGAMQDGQQGLEWMVRMSLFYLPASAIVAVTWSCALWAILMID